MGLGISIWGQKHLHGNCEWINREPWALPSTCHPRNQFQPLSQVFASPSRSHSGIRSNFNTGKNPPAILTNPWNLYRPLKNFFSPWRSFSSGAGLPVWKDTENTTLLSIRMENKRRPLDWGLLTDDYFLGFFCFVFFLFTLRFLRVKMFSNIQQNNLQFI